jgi:hypothetical protein
MTYNLKKDYLKHWDLQLTNKKPIINIENDDDDQDIYISERSSVASSNDLNQTLTPIDKRSPTPLTILPIPIKQTQNFRHPYNELSDNNILVVTQYQHQQRKEKTKTKDFRKVSNGHSFPETKTPEYGENYYPYWYYQKGKNPDWIMRHRQANDGQMISYDALDPSQHNHQPVLITSPIKPQQPTRKYRNHHVSNQDKQRLDHTENNSNISPHLITHENHETNHQKRRSSPKPHISLKDSDPDEYRIQPSKRTISKRRNLKIENDWTENHVQTIPNGRPVQDPNGLIITSNALGNRSKHRSKLPDKNATNSDMDENGKYRSHHHQIPTQPQNTPSIPSHQTHHHNHLHIRRRPPSGTYHTSDVHVVDVSFKKPDRSSNNQQVRDQFHSSIPTIANQTPRLPLIMRDHHQPKNQSPRFPVDYYGTLARQTHGKNWDESMNTPRVYKPDPQTRFYDRYLHNIVDKRLAA